MTSPSSSSFYKGTGTVVAPTYVLGDQLQAFNPVAHQFLIGISALGVVSAAQPAFSDLSGVATAAQVPGTLNATTFPTVNVTTGYQFNGQTVLYAQPSLNNLFIGRNSGNQSATGTTNITVGYGTLGSLTSGIANVAIGFDALQNNTSASGNVAIGLNALGSTTTGAYNVAISGQALSDLTTGQLNTAIGWNALAALTTGQNNVAIGYNALPILTGGVLYNTVIGAGSAQLMTSGQYNTVLGGYAGNALTSGQINTIIGYNSGPAITTGQQNVCIGFGAGGGITTGNYNVCIGYTGGAAVNNCIFLGDGAGTLRLDYGSTASGIWSFSSLAATLKPQTFSALPAASTALKGSVACVTDSTTATWGATITGSGTHVVMAFCNGTNWTVFGA